MMLRESAKLIQLVWGLFLFSLGIVMTIQANLGLSPWDVFHQGFCLMFNTTMGMANIWTAGVLIAACYALKEHIGIGTLFNMVLIGYFIDVLMLDGWVPVVQNLWGGVALMIGGLFVIALASVFYIGAGYGAGPRDSLMVVLAKRLGRSIGFCRCAIEGSALFIGWLLGGKVGIGTVICALGIGIAVQIVFSLLRFDVRSVSQESFSETFLRWKTWFQK